MLDPVFANKFEAADCQLTKDFLGALLLLLLEPLEGVIDLTGLSLNLLVLLELTLTLLLLLEHGFLPVFLLGLNVTM